MRKKKLRGVRYRSRSEIVRAIRTALKAMTEEEFRKTILEKWPEQMKKCVEKGRRYYQNELDSDYEDDSDSE